VHPAGVALEGPARGRGGRGGAGAAGRGVRPQAIVAAEAGRVTAGCGVSTVPGVGRAWDSGSWGRPPRGVLPKSTASTPPGVSGYVRSFFAPRAGLPSASRSGARDHEYRSRVLRERGWTRPGYTFPQFLPGQTNANAGVVCSAIQGCRGGKYVAE